MEPYKLKVKIGDFEFEAEGPAEDVQQQFAAFKELISSVSPIKKTSDIAEQTQNATSTNHNNNTPPALEKVTRVDDRIVSLTGRADSTPEAIMVILLGQKTFRSNESVTGGEIIDGLKQSGIVVPRIDYQLDKMATEGSVIKFGTGRASRYRLTNQGAARAQEIAKAMIAEVA